MELAKNLQQALDAHRRQLSKHIEIWKKIQDRHAQDVEIVAAAESCQKRTEQMIQQCSSIDFLKTANANGTAGSKKQKRSRDEEDLPSAKKTRRVSESVEDLSDNESTLFNGQHIPVTRDPSGLFLIDSNPDVDLLSKVAGEEKKSQKTKKRGHEPEAEDEHINIPPVVESSDEEVPIPKHKKAKHSVPIQEPPKDDAEEYNEEMEKKVVLRLKEKDETSKKKANKKRKRESDVSVEENQVESGERTKAPPAKKRKGKAAAPTAPTAPTAATLPDSVKAKEGVMRKKRDRPEKDVRDGPSQPKSTKKKKGKGSA